MVIEFGGTVDLVVTLHTSHGDNVIQELWEDMTGRMILTCLFTITYVHGCRDFSYRLLPSRYLTRKQTHMLIVFWLKYRVYLQRDTWWYHSVSTGMINIIYMKMTYIVYTYCQMKSLRCVGKHQRGSYHSSMTPVCCQWCLRTAPALFALYHVILTPVMIKSPDVSSWYVPAEYSSKFHSRSYYTCWSIIRCINTCQLRMMTSSYRSRGGWLIHHHENQWLLCDVHTSITIAGKGVIGMKRTNRWRWDICPPREIDVMTRSSFPKNSCRWTWPSEYVSLTCWQYDQRFICAQVKIAKEFVTRASQVVSHLSTGLAQTRLTSQCGKGCGRLCRYERTRYTLCFMWGIATFLGDKKITYYMACESCRVYFYDVNVHCTDSHLFIYSTQPPSSYHIRTMISCSEISRKKMQKDPSSSCCTVSFASPANFRFIYNTIRIYLTCRC